MRAESAMLEQRCAVCQYVEDPGCPLIPLAGIRLCAGCLTTAYETSVRLPALRRQAGLAEDTP
jgi:hypothetical protein